MVKAIVTEGDIRLLEPLPADWQEGQTLRVEKTNEPVVSVDEIDRDFDLLAKLCADSEDADELQLQSALDEARRQAKEQVRQHMGL